MPFGSAPLVGSKMFIRALVPPFAAVCQVNYTRKVQHFAAYLVPLLFTPTGDCDCRGTLEVSSSYRFL